MIIDSGRGFMPLQSRKCGIERCIFGRIVIPLYLWERQSAVLHRKSLKQQAICVSRSVRSHSDEMFSPG